jgi:hypothetical protein
MMDLGTMQTKIDNEEYRSMDEFQVSPSIRNLADRTGGSRDHRHSSQNFQSSWNDTSQRRNQNVQSRCQAD